MARIVRKYDEANKTGVWQGEEEFKIVEMLPQQ